jgi:hypothetical protein
MQINSLVRPSTCYLHDNTTITESLIRIIPYLHRRCIRPDLGPYPTIVSLSLGTPRLFKLRPNPDPNDPTKDVLGRQMRTYEIELGHNSLLIMVSRSHLSLQGVRRTYVAGVSIADILPSSSFSTDRVKNSINTPSYLLILRPTRSTSSVLRTISTVDLFLIRVRGRRGTRGSTLPLGSIGLIFIRSLRERGRGHRVVGVVYLRESGGP